MSDSYSSTITRPTQPASRSVVRDVGVEGSEGDGWLEHLIQEFERRWRRGERPSVEEFLRLHPELNDEPSAAVELIYEEICQRRHAGETVSEEQIATRFPQWRSQLELLWDCDRLLQDGASEPKFPAVGETLGDFSFLAELGRGRMAAYFWRRSRRWPIA